MKIIDDCRTAEDVEARRISVCRRRKAFYAVPKSPVRIEVVAKDCPVKVPVIILRPIIPFRKIKISGPVTGRFLFGPRFIDSKLKTWPSLEHIICAVSSFYEVSLEDILSRRQARRASFPRQIVYYLAREITILSLPEIALQLANRDHTTILHGARRIEKIAKSDERLRDELELLEIKIQEMAQNEPIL